MPDALGPEGGSERALSAFQRRVERTAAAQNHRNHHSCVLGVLSVAKTLFGPGLCNMPVHVMTLQVIRCTSACPNASYSRRITYLRGASAAGTERDT